MYSFSVVSLGINIYSSASCNSSSVKCPTSISTHPTTTTLHDSSLIQPWHCPLSHQQLLARQHNYSHHLVQQPPAITQRYFILEITFIHSEDMHVDVHIKTQYYDTVEVHTCTCKHVLTHVCTRIRFLLFL